MQLENAEAALDALLRTLALRKPHWAAANDLSSASVRERI
jgi:hypothetical protein